MTRFARAKGSKASNERVFSDPTPWVEMKNQMLKRKQEVEDEKKRREAEAKRNENYKKFLKEREEGNASHTEWAEFPEETEPKQNGLSDKSKTIKKTKNKIKNLKKAATLTSDIETATGDTNTGKVLKRKQKSKNADINENNCEVEDMKPKKKKLKIIQDNVIKDPDMVSFENEKSITKKKKKSKKGDPSLQQNGEVGAIVITKNNDEDDIPIETSSKVKLSEPVIKKVKTKNKKIKIANGELAKNKDKKDSKNGGKQKRKEIDYDSLSEEAKKKIMKKQEKRRKQLEKKKLKKLENTDESGNNEAENSNLDKNKVKPINSDKKKINKSKNESVKPEHSIKGPKLAKVNPKKHKLDKGEVKRRKDFQPNKIMVNGNEVELEYFDGFPIKKEDAQNLMKLKKEMISKGLPRSEINRTLKLERRKAEKALAREKKKVCFNCRKFGHNLSDCPILSNKEELVDTSGAGICFKCGSTEHTSFVCRVVQGQNFKFATCFICKEQGHISRQCPDNARGLYPKGGSCRVCGDVTHLKKDCPQHQEQQRREEAKFQVGSIFDGNPEDIEPSKDISKPKIIKF